MIYTTHRVSLDIHDTSSQVFITVKRGVTNRQIFAYLTEDGKPYTLTEDCYAVFDAKKEDGGILHNSCEINGNCIKYNFTEATVSSVGKVYCEFKVYGKDGALITSPTFTIIVHDSTVCDEDIVAAVHESTELERLMASYIPCTVVEELPAVSDGVKGIVYRVEDSFYTKAKRVIGEGALEVGKKIKTLSVDQNGLSVLNSIKDGPYTLCYLDGNRVYYEGSIYSGEGVLYFQNSEQGDGFYMYETRSFDLLPLYAQSSESEGLTVDSFTELGLKVFGGVVDGWKNFITGEEVG